MKRQDRGTVVGRYTRWVIRHRVWVLLASVALTVAAGVGIKNLGLASNYRVFFGRDNPDLMAFDAVENIYTKNDNILFVVKPREGDVFTESTLGAVRALTAEAWQIPYSTRVDAVTNFQHTWSQDDNLTVEDLLPEGPITPKAVARVRDISLREPLLVGRLVSRDGTATGVNVRISLPGRSEAELPKAATYARELEARFRAEHPDLEIHTTGISMLNASFTEAPMNDMPLVMPLMLAALVLAVVLFLRSAAGAMSTLAVVVFSTVAALGVAGLFGVVFDPTSASAPIIILTLAIADSIHILVSFGHALRRGLGRHAALVDAMERNAQPVFLTSITSAVGFLSLNFSDAPPYRLLGNVTAFGLMVAWLFSMTLLPAAIAVLPIRARRGSDIWERFSTRFGAWVVAHYRAVLVGMAVVAVVLGSAITTLKINDRYFEYFDDSLAFRRATDFALDNLTGLYGASFSLDAGETQGVSDPEFLATVDAFTQWLRSRPNVAHVNSFSDTMKRLNRNMHNDDPAAYRIPERRDLGAQYLLLYELSLPYGLDVNDQINVDKSALRVDVTYGDVDMTTIEAEVALAERWLRQHGTPSMRDSRAASPTLMFANITRRNIASMVLGTAVGFAAIAIILMIALRNVRLGIISLIPNILPAAMAFGVWALLVGEVGFAISVVAGLSIGIIVDDTVHLLSKYNHARRTHDAETSIRYAFASVGSAILGTTAIVAVGFAMLGLSTFRVTAYMGILTSLTVASALVVDFLLLPALLMAFDRAPVREPAPSAAPALSPAGATTH